MLDAVSWYDDVWHELWVKVRTRNSEVWDEDRVTSEEKSKDWRFSNDKFVVQRLLRE